jgi:hypothetical protein
MVPGMDHLPPLREPGLVLRTITNTLAPGLLTLRLADWV